MNPHKRNVCADGRRAEGVKTQEHKPVIGFKSSDSRELLLINFVSTRSPGICHINEPHTFEAEQIDIGTAVEFPTDDCPNGT
jgi:hypothetical protein